MPDDSRGGAGPKKTPEEKRPVSKNGMTRKKGKVKQWISKKTASLQPLYLFRSNRKNHITVADRVP